MSTITSLEEESADGSSRRVPNEHDRQVGSGYSKKKKRSTTTTTIRKRKRAAADKVLVQDFAALDLPQHPYGVLPGGNRFLVDASAACKPDDDENRDDPTRLLDDESWYHVLSFCNGKDLGHLVQTCRYFYVSGSQPELWRDLVLRAAKQQGGGGDSTTIISKASSCWKDTFVKLNYPAAARCLRPHVPMSMSGSVYSDFFYRLHSCRSFAIPSAWLDNTATDNTVPRIPVQDMTSKLFVERYERPNRPVVISGAAQSWKAFQKWQDPTYLLQHGRGRTFRATSGMAPLPAQFTLEAYYEYCQTFTAANANLEEAPLYLFDRTALQTGSPLWNDYMPDLKRTCPYWDPSNANVQDDDDNSTSSIGCHDHDHDLFQWLGEGRRPDHTWLIMGPKRSGSVFHIDPNATHAWNATICGRKRWLFYPPGIAPPGVHPTRDGDEVTLPLSIGEWLFQFWNEHVERKASAPPQERPLECTALPGDILFVPHGWWHMVINLDEINIAITHNYVSRSNLSSVLKFLDQKRDQVSGCRDRSESIKPERLYEEFVKELEKHHPDWLSEALSDPNWACRAWDTTTVPRKKQTSADGDLSKEGVDTRGTSNTQTSVMAKAKGGDGVFSFSFI